MPVIIMLFSKLSLIFLHTHYLVILCASGAWFLLPFLTPNTPAVALTTEQCSQFYEFLIQPIASFAKKNLGILEHSLPSQSVNISVLEVRDIVLGSKCLTPA